MEPIALHHHAVGLGASQDLINTLELSEEGSTDALATPNDAVRFLAATGVASPADLGAEAAREGEDRWLARVRGARAAMREVWDATVEGRAPASTAIEAMNEVLDHAPRLQLRATPRGVEVAHRHPVPDPTGEALARIATPLIDAIAAGRTSRFRVCANDACRWVFEDESRAGRRRWCDMSTCGNRAKVRRYRSRRRERRDDTAPDTAPDRPPAG